MSTPKPDLDAQIACVKREIALRAAVYPGLVDRRKMTANRAAYEQAAMTGVLDTLEALKALAAAGDLRDPPSLQEFHAEDRGHPAS